MMNEKQVLTELRDMVSDWREKESFGLGPPEYYDGIDSARNSCADRLEEVVNRVEKEQRGIVILMQTTTRGHEKACAYTDDREVGEKWKTLSPSNYTVEISYVDKFCDIASMCNQ